MGLLDPVRRALGLHVHEWELVDSREVDEEQAVRESSPRGPLPGQEVSFSPELITVPVEIATFKCKACGKVKESRVSVGS